MAVDLQRVLAQGQRFAAGHNQLPLHEVQAGDRFRDWVFDLEARVHLHKKETHRLRLVIAGLFHNEFHRARAHIVHRARCCHSGCAHLGAQGLGHAGGGGFFQHLLVAALHRAVALKQVDVIAVTVAKHLDLDVARTLYIFFNQHRAVAKAAHGFALAAGQGGGKFGRRLHDAHALATAASAGLDQDGVANAVRLALQERGVLVSAVVAGHQRHTGAFHQLFGFRFQTHSANGAGRGANKGEARVGAGLREGVVLAQKTVARVDGLRAGSQGGVNDGLPAQIAVLRGACANVHRLVAQLHVARAGVRV